MKDANLRHFARARLLLALIMAAMLGTLLWATTASAQAQQPLNLKVAQTVDTAQPTTKYRGRRKARGSRYAPVPNAAASQMTSPLAEQINANTVSIISGNLTGSYLRFAGDISSVLDDGDKLRVLAIMGKGAVQNVADIVFLKGVDMGLIRTDSFEAIRREGKIKDVEKLVDYVARLAPDEMHIIARNEITDIHQLAGKKVNFDVVGSGSYFTTGLIFEKLGIKVTSTGDEQNVAYEKLKAGEIDASVFFGGKPVAGFVNFKNDGRFHLVPVPFDDRLTDYYLPAQLTSKEYPNLIPAGGVVETIAASTVLAVINLAPGSERYNKVARFVDAFFSRFSEFQKPPRHPKWKEVNIAGNVPGMTRFKAAQDWLDKNAAKKTDQSAEFSRFLETKQAAGANAPDSDKDRLFREFLEWNRTHTKQ